MDSSLEKYLEMIDKHLKPLMVSERVDIIKEIKSSMQDMEKEEGLTPQEIIAKLGDPKILAKAYLGNLLAKSNHFDWNRMLVVIAFYSAAGLSGMIAIPCLAVLAVMLRVCALISVLGGTIKLAAFIFQVEVPFVIMQIGSFELGPIAGFIVGILFAVLLYQLGKGSWTLLLRYIAKVSETKKDLSI